MRASRTVLLGMILCSCTVGSNVQAAAGSIHTNVRMKPRNKERLPTVRSSTIFPIR